MAQSPSGIGCIVRGIILWSVLDDRLGDGCIVRGIVLWSVLDDRLGDGCIVRGLSCGQSWTTASGTTVIVRSRFTT